MSFPGLSADPQAILFDGSLMVGGFLLMFAYTLLMLGRLTWLECRLWLAVVGLFRCHHLTNFSLIFIAAS